MSEEKIRIEWTKCGIPIVLKSTIPFDELGLVLSNVLHMYDVANLGLTKEEIDDAIKIINNGGR